MNIATATLYATHGYKIRRPNWKGEIYLNPKGNHPEAFVFGPEAYFTFSMDDLMADDWEMVR
jgi:hypothetical protein